MTYLLFFVLIWKYTRALITLAIKLTIITTTFKFLICVFELKQVASRNNDVQLADFVESEFLGEQVDIKSHF